MKLTEYSASLSYGWQNTADMGATSRSGSNLLNKDFHHGTDGTFVVDLPNGEYDLVLGLGDASAVRDRISVWVEGQLLIEDFRTNAGQFAEIRSRVTVSDGQLTVRLVDGGGQTARFAATKLCATPVNPDATRLWSDSATPSAVTSSVTKKTEVGVRFQSGQDGFITGIRYYKAKNNSGTHIGNLWSADGTLLASAVFTNETATGWQQVTFDQPVPVTAGQTYIASYLAPRGHYSVSNNYFNPSGLRNGPLEVLPTAQNGGGVYQPGGGFPTTTFQASNYWVDVVYADDLTAPTVTSVSPANGATGVSTATTVRVTFSEAMDPATISGSTVELKAGGTSIGATVSYDPATNTAILTPSAPLANSTQYTVLVHGGSDGLVVRDEAGLALAADFTSVFTTVPGGPTANAGADKTSNEASSVSFTGSASGGTGTLTYLWDFGDGQTASGTLTPSHTYADNGTYTVTLTVTDADNRTASDTATVTVSNVAPTASLTNNGPVNTGSNVTISFGSQNDVSGPDRTAGYRYSYDFNNDGVWELTDVAEATATTSYATAGNKIVKGRIKDKDGGFTVYTTTVTVNGPLTADAGANKTANEASSVSFTGTAGGGAGTLTYLWDFGDGQTASGTLTPSHTYADNGTYTVTLTVTDSNNQTASDTATVTVNNVAPTASLSNNGPVLVNESVTITFGSQNDVSGPDRTAGYRYSYDFNNDGVWDQTDVTGATATTSYNTAGNKIVKARIKDKDGGFTDYTTTVTVNDPSQGPTYYVSPTGSDTNNGSSGSPWRTLQKASDMAQPGDTIIVRSGNYNGFAVSRSGTSTARITFKADPGVIIDTPSATGGVDAGIVGSGRDYITIEGFTFEPRSGQTQWDAAIRFNSGPTSGVHRLGNIYRNNVAKVRVGGPAADTYYHTFYASWQDGILIEGNTVQDGYNSGIYVANSSKNYIVRKNIVSGVGGNGIHNNGDLSAGSPGVNKFALIEGNTIFNVGYGMGGQAISFDGVQDSVIRNNLLYNIHAKGISLYNTNGAAGSIRNTIVNNTVIMASDGYTPLRINHNASGTTVFNNIFIAASSTAPWTDSEESGLSGSKFDYNVTFGVAMVGGVKRTDWKSSYGFDAHSISSTVALLFVNPAINDYRLLATSPAINIGITTFNGKTAPTVDILGNSRPFGGGIDIGAYEFIG